MAFSAFRVAAMLSLWWFGSSHAFPVRLKPGSLPCNPGPGKLPSQSCAMLKKHLYQNLRVGEVFAVWYQNLGSFLAAVSSALASSPRSWIRHWIRPLFRRAAIYLHVTYLLCLSYPRT